MIRSNDYQKKVEKPQFNPYKFYPLAPTKPTSSIPPQPVPYPQRFN